MQHTLTPVLTPFRADTGSAAHRNAPAAPRPLRTLTSRTLLDGANEVQIEHYGSVYRLRLTALGNSGATPAAGLRGEIVYFPNLAALEAAPEGSLRGKIAFVPPKAPFYSALEVSFTK